MESCASRKTSPIRRAESSAGSDVDSVEARGSGDGVAGEAQAIDRATKIPRTRDDLCAGNPRELGEMIMSAIWTEVDRDSTAELRDRTQGIDVTRSCVR